MKPFTTGQVANISWNSNNTLPWGVSNNSGSKIYQLGETSVIGRQLSATIVLNKNMLEQSSQLLIAATAIHESLHAVINYNLQSAYYDQQDSKFSAGSWLYGIDSWIVLNGLPSNFSNHYEMMDFYFDKAVDILASWDHNNHSLDDYRKTMLYGLDNSGVDVTSQNQSLIVRLNTEYQALLSKFGYTATDLNTYWTTQLQAPSTNQLPNNGCN